MAVHTVVLNSGWRASWDPATGACTVTSPSRQRFPCTYERGYLLGLHGVADTVTVRLHEVMAARCTVCGRDYGPGTRGEGRKTDSPACRKVLSRREAAKRAAGKRAVSSALKALRLPAKISPADRALVRQQISRQVERALDAALPLVEPSQPPAPARVRPAPGRKSSRPVPAHRQGAPAAEVPRAPRETSPPAAAPPSPPVEKAKVADNLTATPAPPPPPARVAPAAPVAQAPPSPSPRQEQREPKRDERALPAWARRVWE